MNSYQSLFGKEKPRRCMIVSVIDLKSTRKTRSTKVAISKQTSVKPLGGRVLVKIKDAEEKTEGGILLPATAQTKPKGGEVVVVGDGKSVGKSKVDIGVSL
ncbi:hypothetical protein RJT34_00291 [Clitoria ternatea]|uniref:10 kDa chaperonin n=1 Tax=Clitoria ternatea TaxID=43366 RepID=A0AAN9KGJ2_CLITE